ncbi:adenosylcobinamide-phosphate guanylyltransferase [Klebsiella pneumoniae]|uniref:Adenosylcobinamide-phosphate guanylyltransferase n=1 Tax=Klebsiella pneumoniae TaxID=573 RepID=A0A378FTH4_KLEPN|nr:adenosylcobinamide-phosphate guanylyltransferase [Klebsiella pneumoniae]
MLTLVTGGARSGKSRHAEALIADAPQVLYIATRKSLTTRWPQGSSIIATGRPAHWAHRRALAAA